MNVTVVVVGTEEIDCVLEMITCTSHALFGSRIGIVFALHLNGLLKTLRPCC